jgi:hypothetical protein
MKKMRLLTAPAAAAAAVAVLLILSACGPIYSVVSKASEGIREFKVVEGDLSMLKPQGRLLVYGPFDKTEQAYYIAKGEDAAQFAASFARTGFQKSELYIEKNFAQLKHTAQQMRGSDAARIKKDYGLEAEPDTILFGTLVERGPVTVVPFRAVFLTTYRLEFFDVASGASTVVEVQVKMRYEEIIPNIVEEIVRRAGHAAGQ